MHRPAPKCARSGRRTSLPSPGQLVGRIRRDGRVPLLRPFARQLGERTLNLTYDAPDSDAEHALPTLDQVDDLVGGRALVDGRPVAHQRDVGEVLDAALAQVL